jgi:hypothetical protein
MVPSFVADPNVSKIAETYAADAVEFAKKSFQTKLDWTDESIGLVEAILMKSVESMRGTRRRPSR